MALNTFNLVSLSFTVLVVLVIFVLKILIAKRSGITCAAALVGLVIYMIGVGLSVVFGIEILFIFIPISLVLILFQHFITLSSYGPAQDESKEEEPTEKEEIKE